jgi:hypothetical protein
MAREGDGEANAPIDRLGIPPLVRRLVAGTVVAVPHAQMAIGCTPSAPKRLGDGFHV